jgi:quinol monooxygenase YgiN
MWSRKTLFFLLAIMFLFVVSTPILAGDYPGDNKMITVSAIVKVKPGNEKIAKEEMLKLVPLTRREPGCIQYDMHVNVGTEENDYLKEDPKLYMFYENWRSRQDWDLHMDMPYLKRWFDMSKDVCENIDITIWEMLKLPTSPVFRGLKNPDPKEQYTLMARVHIKPKDACGQYKIPDCVDRSWKEMLSLVPLTHLEPGCINYEMHVNLDMNTMGRNHREIMFYENWYDFKVWKYDHMLANYLKAWFALAPNVTTGIELTGWKMMDFIQTPAK